MGTWITTREVVKSALDSKETARNNAQIDRAIESASRSVEGLLHRRLAPTLATRYFDWPNQQYARAYRLWLDENDLISVTSVTAGGTAISASDYFLEPVNSGPPYNRLELDLGSAAAFGGGDTHQRSIAITGLWGIGDDSEPAGILAAAISSTSATSCNVSDSSLIGVGSILKVDSERLIVTEKSWLTTSQTLQTPLTASQANVTVAVTTGSAYNIGEVILLDSERMLILDISGNNLTVKRAWDGSALAAHTGSTIYAPRTLTLTRGALGTVAATHLISAPITKWAPPALIRDLVVAEALNALQQETSGYAHTIGSGESERETLGRGLSDIRKAALRAYGRHARIRSV